MMVDSLLNGQNKVKKFSLRRNPAIVDDGMVIRHQKESFILTFVRPHARNNQAAIPLRELPTKSYCTNDLRPAPALSVVGHDLFSTCNPARRPSRNGGTCLSIEARARPALCC